MTDTKSEYPPVAVTPEMLLGCQALLAGAVRIASYAYTQVPADHWDRIRRAVDEGQAALTVQVDLPAGTVSVLVDGQGWIAPQCLLRIQPAPPIETKLDG